MKPSLRPRRSALYMPASNPRAVAKARELDCDIVILDLEDAVLPEAKPAARAAAVAALAEGGFGRREVMVRVNGLETEWGAADLAAIAAAGPDGVLVPKIRDAGDIAACDSALAAAPGHTALWAMIETVQAVFRLDSIAAASAQGRLCGFVMGINDLAREMGARQTPDRAPFWAAMALSVTAARAHGLAILDGVHNAIEDLEALEAVCRQGGDFGFDGKSLIHPSHLAICNRAFSPDPDELAWSRAVITAFDAAENAGRGALRVGGRLAERLHYDQARRLIAVAETIDAAA